MSDSEKGIWNGGETNRHLKYEKLIRESEDYYDIIDSEKETRDDIKKHHKTRKPYHELYRTEREK
jgi:hypothetical protein|tara:strand:- start:1145 stop:1339 length:195 start_codon:yes stop_codon:yes gene_type:complete